MVWLGLRLTNRTFKHYPDNETEKPTHSETRIEQLRNHLDTLREMVKNTSKTGPEENVEMQNVAVNAMGDVTKDEFKINRGTNTSARVQNAFDETRVEQILKAVEIGPDLTDEQREQVRSLVREYADVFALSLSEVLYVDWHKHKLNIDPKLTFPTKIK